MASPSKTEAPKVGAPAEAITTPDDRYIVVRGRLWRRSNPDLPPAERQRLVDALMKARREIGRALRTGLAEDEARWRLEVDRCKHALGERGPVWWTDGAPDLNRRLVRTTPYAAWFDSLRAGTARASER